MHEWSGMNGLEAVSGLQVSEWGRLSGKKEGIGLRWSTPASVTDSLPTDQYLDVTSQPGVKSLDKCKTMVSEKDCSRNWKMNIANSPLCLSNGFSLISPVSQLDIGYPPNNTNQATLPGKFLKKVNFVWIRQLEVRDDLQFECFFCWNVKKRSRGQYILLKANKELEVEFLKAILGRCKDITAKPKFLD